MVLGGIRGGRGWGACRLDGLVFAKKNGIRPCSFSPLHHTMDASQFSGR